MGHKHLIYTNYHVTVYCTNSSCPWSLLYCIFKLPSFVLILKHKDLHIRSYLGWIFNFPLHTFFDHPAHIQNITKEPLF